MKSVILSLLIAFSFGYTNASNPKEIRAINNYINFLNESIHGLLIAHRLFDNYNQTVNKYVDLPDYHLNNYSNADLPDNIFQDPEKWFYDRSPYEWYDIAIRESKFLGTNSTKLNRQITEIKKILGSINLKRLEIDEYLNGKDFGKIENLRFIYNELENVVALYEDFYNVYRSLEKELGIKKRIETLDEDVKLGAFDRAFLTMYSGIKNELHSIRRQGDVSAPNLQHLRVNLLEVEKIVSVDNRRQIQKRILTNLSRLMKFLEDFQEDKPIPTEYNLHGKHYYYYNIVLLNKTNRYGNGFVQEYNNICIAYGRKMIMEIPQVFKVIYPKKLPKEDLEQLDNKGIALLLDKEIIYEGLPRPEQIANDRNIIVHKEKIFVDTSIFDLELYDHLIKDGDRVSLNVNGIWKFRNISLEKIPRRVTIEVIPGQKNFILIHADNEGYRPPNTLALAYVYKGKRRKIEIKSDLKNSQVVEIFYDLSDETQ